MAQQSTLGKAERLKSRKLIDQVFREGKSFMVFPYRVFYLLPGHNEVPRTDIPMPGRGARTGRSGAPAPLQAGFGASSRHFRRAVDRNRIKRLGREAYRVQKQALFDHLHTKGISMAVFFVFTGKELPDHKTVTGKIGVALQKLIRESA